MQNNKIKNIKPFWDNEYKNLDYRKEIFNDEYAIEEWRKQGYDNDVYSFSGKWQIIMIHYQVGTIKY